MTGTGRREGLAGALRGQVLTRDDHDFDEARRVWNGMIDRRPALIARCESSADVVEALGFAQQHGLPVAIRGGGHSVAGLSVCDDGLVIDLGPMNGVEVDAAGRTARVGPGCRWGDVDAATQAHGLATTGGFDSRTGVAGLTLGGGIGYLARRVGLAIDNLLSAEVVTAAGEVVRASETEHPDLFWALRGGGGNFGIVTEFEFRLHELGPEVMTAQVFYPFEEAAAVLRSYRDYALAAPNDIVCYALVVHVPPAEPFPEEWHGQPTVALVACHTGPPSQAGDAAEHLVPLTRLGSPLLEVVAPMPYTALQQSFDAGAPDGARYYWKGEYLYGLTDEAIDTFVDATGDLPGELSVAGFEHLGGAVAEVEPAATAFPHRGAAFQLGIFAGWTDPAEDGGRIAWAREFHRRMAPFGIGAGYVNYLDHDDRGRVPDVYGPNLARLRDVKAQYDPGNVFHGNANIAPST
jgi:FAD/FMN-containing dehydrogenase